MKKNLIFLSLLFVIGVFLSCNKEEVDNTAPEITLIGDTLLYINLDSAYIEPGYIAIDDVDGDISVNVNIDGVVDSSTEGDYYLKYNVKDAAGNMAEEKTRIIRVLLF